MSNRPHESSLIPDDPVVDPVIEAYKAGVDRTLIRENLKLTPEQRLRNLAKLQAFAEELKRAGREARGGR